MERDGLISSVKLRSFTTILSVRIAYNARQEILRELSIRKIHIYISTFLEHHQMCAAAHAHSRFIFSGIFEREAK